MLRRLLSFLAIPLLLAGNVHAQFGRGGSSLDLSTLLPIIADSSRWTDGSTVNAIKPRDAKTVEADSAKFGALHVTGNTILDGNLTMVTTATEQVKLGTGSDAAPELSSAGDTNTGIRFPGGDKMQLVQNGLNSHTFRPYRYTMTYSDGDTAAIWLDGTNLNITSNAGTFVYNNMAGITSTYTSIGYLAMQHNSGSNVTGFGSYVLQTNKGNSCSGFGYAALSRNIGDGANGFGYAAMQYNTGVNVDGQGSYLLQYNSGSYIAGLGNSALMYNGGSYNSVLGNDAFNTFNQNSSAAKTFDAANIVTTVADTITITSHGFGSAGAYANLYYTQGTGAITGLTNARVYKWKIVDANKIVSAGGQDITAAGTGTGHTFTPQHVYTNSTAVGYDAEPTASNQVVLGNENVTSVKTAGSIYINRPAKTDSLWVANNAKTGRDSTSYGGPDGSLNSLGDNGGLYHKGTSGQATNIKQATVLLTIGPVAAATDTCLNLIPAGSMVVGVTTRVITAVTGDAGFTGFSVGTVSDPDAWGANLTPTINETSDLTDCTITSVPLYPTATSVILTQVGGSVFVVGGVVRVTVHYISLTAPTG